MEFIRQCPKCEKEITYKNKKSFNRANKNKSLCPSCIATQQHLEKNPHFQELKENGLKRGCPVCGKEIHYDTIGKYNEALKINATCSKSCGAKKQGNPKLKRNCPICNKELYYSSQGGLTKAIENNDYCLKCANRISQNKPEQKAIRSNYSKGKNNPMFGKTYKDVWLAKYGEEKANKLHKEKCVKNSISSSGTNNPMYNKPAPNGAGNGLKGRYKGIYFRSLKELYYLKFLFDNNIKFENGEKREYKIEYEFMNKKCNYFLDFYLPETDEYIEIKPKRLVETPRNKAKFISAKNKLGDKFKILTEDDLEEISLDKLYEMYINKEILFNIKSEERFLEYYNKKLEEIVS